MLRVGSIIVIKGRLGEPLSRHGIKRVLLGVLGRHFCLMSVAPPPPAFPRLSASLIVVNDRNEVLLVHRNPGAKAFGGLHVFPGGVYDARQDDSLAMTAVRETFEETGLLIAGPGSTHLDEQTTEDARRAVHSHQLLFKTFLEHHRLKVDESAILPFMQWITPVHEPRRFRAQFFVTFLPPPSDPVPVPVPNHGGNVSSSSASAPHPTRPRPRPTPDTAQEVLAAHFRRPAHTLADFARGRLRLFPPQFYLLCTLGALLPAPRTAPAERARVEALARGAFGRACIAPRVVPGPYGPVVVLLDGDEEHGGPPGRRHRLVAADTSTQTTDGARPIGLTLERNFNIFCDAEWKAPLGTSKL